jgi:hypothetical protein
MVKNLVPKRFIKENISGRVYERFDKFLGPIKNFYGINTIEYVNIRMTFHKSGIRKFNIVNEYNNKYIDKVNEFVKGVLRCYSDGIFTNVINKNLNFRIISLLTTLMRI